MVTTNSTSRRLAQSTDQTRMRRRGLRKALLTPLVCSVMASIGMFGGISALFAGAMCVVFHGVLKQDILFSQVGTVLLIIAIPMILLGSVFLDEIDLRK
ncbi:MAG: hypothetical protein ABJA02_13870 [Acidobacteriota bacterium]